MRKWSKGRKFFKVHQHRSTGCCVQEKKNNKNHAFNELVQGVLTFSIREAHSDMPDEPAEGESTGGQAS